MDYSEDNVILNYSQQGVEHLLIFHGLRFTCVHAFLSYSSCIYVSIKLKNISYVQKKKLITERADSPKKNNLFTGIALLQKG